MMLRSEFNARIHAIATILVLVAGVFFGIERSEWLAVTLAITAVWTTEAVNTAIEALCDAVTQREQPLIGRAKDLAAGAVLLAAIGATAVAVIVFGRRIVLIVAT